MTRFAAIFFFCAVPLFCQSNSGELRLRVTDPDGLGVKTMVQIVSKGNQYRNTLATTDQGTLDVHRLPYGIYQLEIKQPGFPAISGPVDIHSSIPTEYAIQLKLPSVNQSVTVNSTSTLIDPDQAGAVSQIELGVAHRQVAVVDEGLEGVLDDRLADRFGALDDALQK